MVNSRYGRMRDEYGVRSIVVKSKKVVDKLSTSHLCVVFLLTGVMPEIKKAYSLAESFGSPMKTSKDSA